MVRYYTCFQIASIVFIIFFLSLGAYGQNKVALDKQTMGELEWRSIGPAQFGGRVADIEGVPGNPDIFYVAHSSAGLFKTTNGGITFSSIFDEENTLSIGAVALKPGNPKIIYVGTGEGDPRNSISFGDGIYKSTDGGKTWNHLGLKNTERFSEIVIHPERPDIVYAAAMGHAWGANKQRGIFRSTDGGQTWKKILYTNSTSGASDVHIELKNPNIVYAGMYDYLRKPWHFRGGGPGSGLYRSTDGGDTWTHLTDPNLENGLPGKGLIGRVGVAVSRSNTNVVYTLLESEKEGQLWRSKDRGITWEVVNDSRSINTRAFYYTDLRIDPKNENRVYTLSSAMQISSDGGRTFEGVSYQKMFGDVHAMWIDPQRPNHFITGSDGGFFISNDYGKNFEFLNTLPFAQAYHVGVDMADPYNVYAGFQDHEIWMGPNEKWNNIGVKGGDWKRLRDWGDGMYAKPDPHDKNIVYYNTHLGDLTRKNLKTGEERFIMPYPLWATGLPASAHRYRFNWNSPVELSPGNHGVIYFGGNVVFKSGDQGRSWEVISPDLTTNDPEKMKVSGGPITTDNTRAEYYCTITSIDVSPFNEQVVWAGTDDGNIQVTRNGGQTWTNVASNIPDLPEHAWVSRIQASPHQAGTAWLSVDQHQMDDFTPHTFVTTDYGNTWRKISNGLEGYVHVIKEDPETPQLLYAGTELGVFVSFDGGKNWTDMRLGLPNLPVRDLVVHPRDNDLIIATHARGFYILDDVTPLQKLAEVNSQQAALFKPMQATRYTPRTDPSTLGDKIFLAENQPYGAIISYYLTDEPTNGQSAKLTIKDSTGTTIKKIEDNPKSGINRVVWELEENLFAHSFDQNIPQPDGAVSGPRVLPGEYTVTLSGTGRMLEQSFNVRLDPNVEVNRTELVEQHKTLRELMLMKYRVELMQNQIETLSEQLAKLQKQVNNTDIAKQAKEIQGALEGISDHFRTPPRSELATSSNNIVDLQSRVGWLIHEIEGYSGRPTEPQIKWTNIFSRQLNNVQKRFDTIFQDDIANLNDRLKSAGVSYTIT